jgi:DNA-directed RNA polymerase specialized sigma24 family protein
MEELIKNTRALMLLQLHTIGAVRYPKAELLLNKAGFSHKEIAELLGKTTTAVAKTISRAQKTLAQGYDDD